MLNTQLRFGCIGVGGMGGALINGVVGNVLPAENVWIVDVDKARVDALCNQLGVHRAESVAELMEQVTCVLYAAKPVHVAGIFPEIASALQPSHWLISIAAGVSTQKLESYFSTPPPIVRVMPNITVAVKAAISAIAAGSRATNEHISLAQDIFNAVGKSLIVEEKYLDAVTGLSGSGPAFVFLFIEALIDAGVQVGLSRQHAHQFAVSTVLGASKMLEETGEHPAVLKNMVTTPGGTTAAGLYELELGRLRAVVADAVISATRRAEELSD